MAFYELRQYKVLPGQMAGWVKIMEEEIIPFQVSKGMVITGSFQGETARRYMSGCAGSRAKSSGWRCMPRSISRSIGRPRSRRGCRSIWTARRSW